MLTGYIKGQYHESSWMTRMTSTSVFCPLHVSSLLYTCSPQASSLTHFSRITKKLWQINHISLSSLIPRCDEVECCEYLINFCLFISGDQTSFCLCPRVYNKLSFVSKRSPMSQTASSGRISKQTMVIAPRLHRDHKYFRIIAPETRIKV